MNDSIVMLSAKYTPNYGTIDYSKHIWLVNKPHAEKSYPEPGQSGYAEIKQAAEYLLTMGEKGIWIIDEFTVKGPNAFITMTYFVDNFLNIYAQRNQADFNSAPFKVCPMKISDHSCGSAQCVCKYPGLFTGFAGYKALTYPLSDEFIDNIKSGLWVLPTDTTRPKIMKYYVESYMEKQILNAELEAMKAECHLVHTIYTLLENELRTIIDSEETAKADLQRLETDMTARLDAARVDRDSLEQHAVWLEDELKKSQAQFNLMRPVNTILVFLCSIIALWILLMNLV